MTWTPGGVGQMADWIWEQGPQSGFGFLYRRVKGGSIETQVGSRGRYMQFPENVPDNSSATIGGIRPT